jgi:hypothetical protein
MIEVVKVSEVSLVRVGGEEGWWEGVAGSPAARCSISVTLLPATTPNSLNVVVLERVSPGGREGGRGREGGGRRGREEREEGGEGKRERQHTTGICLFHPIACMKARVMGCGGVW